MSLINNNKGKKNKTFFSFKVYRVIFDTKNINKFIW